MACIPHLLRFPLAEQVGPHTIYFFGIRPKSQEKHDIVDPLSLGPHATSNKVKLCKLMVKRRRDWGEERQKDFPWASVIVYLGYSACPPNLLSVYCYSKEILETACSLAL